jgi:biopolymer transport protein ExbD
MAVRIKTGRALGALNITPLIDIVFLLLVFFLVATKFAEEERFLDIPMPAASQANALAVPPQQLIINITEDGRYYVRGKFVDQKNLGLVIASVSQNNPLTQSVLLRAHRNAGVQSVVDAVNLCLLYDIQDYALVTEDTGG